MKKTPTPTYCDKRKQKLVRGFTLAELQVAFVIAGIVSLVLASFYVAEYRFRRSLTSDVDIAREARIATNHMTKVLRFASSFTITSNPPDNTMITVQGNAVEGGHITLIPNQVPNQVTVRYTLDTTIGQITFLIVETGQSQVIAENLIYANAVEEVPLSPGGNPRILLSLTFRRNEREISVQTSIQHIV